MKKLNAFLCKDMIGNLNAARSYRGISLSEEIYLQALEIALPVLEMQESTTDTYQQIENDGWIEWGGGVMPVHEDTLLEVRFSDGGEDGPDPAYSWHWNHMGHSMDVFAYRVIENDGR